VTRTVFLAALALAAAATGCIAFDADTDVAVDLLVTADAGTELLDRTTVQVPAESSVLDALREEHTVATAHGGGFVEAIDGRESGYPDERVDWFYHVDTELADVGAAAYPLEDDALVLWDHRPWTRTMTLPHVLTGLDDWPGPALEEPVEPTPDAWRENATTEGRAEDLFARVDGDELVLLDARGEPARRLDPPWVIAHAADGPGPDPSLLVRASGEDGLALADRLATRAPTGLGAAATPGATHEVPAG
jgi:hypothetical protein